MADNLTLTDNLTVTVRDEHAFNGVQQYSRAGYPEFASFGEKLNGFEGPLIRHYTDFNAKVGDEKTHRRMTVGVISNKKSIYFPHKHIHNRI